MKSASPNGGQAAVVAGQNMDAFYLAHHGWLTAWLRRRLGQSDQAADIAQDVFVRILQKTGWEVPNEPRAYLATVAKGLLINFWQRQALESAYLEAVAAMPEALAPSPEDRYLILETLTQIQDVLAGLPPKVSSVFLMSQLDGMRYADIAERTGLSLRTVNRYMTQAFERCLKVML